MQDEPFQLPLFPDRAYLHKVVPEDNQWRFYALTAMPTLFGEWALMREWGRLGSPGTVRTDIHADEGSAITALSEIAQNKRRRGYRATE